MAELRFDTYYRYDALTEILRDFERRYPGLVRVEAIGESYEGRSIWLATVTRHQDGGDWDKPGFWVDGNLHAAELAPSSACLYLIDYLCRCYGEDDAVTRCLDTRVFYICPRVNPDGAEWALADRPVIIRSSTRPYPYDEEPVDGLVPEDVDGDGRILFMRIPDPNGAWKPCPDEPRLLVRRDPAETGGQYYRLLPEGRVRNYDGLRIDVRRRKEGLDLNRNFPVRWRQEVDQRGAGPAPVSEPEVRAVVDFITGHPNLTGGVSFHTLSGVLLRPYTDQPDDAFPAEDLWTYDKIGAQGTAITGYPAVAPYTGFRYHPHEVITGVFDDWLYDHLGLFAWTVELWSPQRQAGIRDYPFIQWFREHPVTDDRRLLQWSDTVLGGRGYIDWYPFAHPDLGPVELGGWDMLHTFQNPPGHLLEQEIAPFPEWLVWSLLISPRLELLHTDVEALGDDTYRVRLAVHNTGWLPSYVTRKALDRGVVRGVVAEIDLSHDASLVAGLPRQELGQLEGRAHKPSAPTLWVTGSDPTKDRAVAEWVVRAPAGTTLLLRARHERAGLVAARVTL